jgi:ubiquinone biosynthesis UbiH/UbiF/VisC/COQ6 family hydroxylase
MGRIALDEMRRFGQCRIMSTQPIVICGQGNGAKIAAISLVAAGFGVHIEPPQPLSAMPDWQNVLALSPAARRMLEVLGVWARLDQPSAAVTQVVVHGKQAQHGQALFPTKLGFARPPASAKPKSSQRAHPQDGQEALEIMAHIVSLASLTRALDATFQALVKAEKIHILTDCIADHHPEDKTLQLEDGSRVACGLLIDSARADKAWRKADLTADFDYHATALTAEIACEQGHGQMAQQIFTPHGPLALLPLPDPNRAALIWSLPTARASALAKADAAIFTYELNRATGAYFGPLELIGKPAKQPLSMRLAQNFASPGRLRIGDGAHLIHPLAGQGFNLTLRDAAELADTLYEGRLLGLSVDDFSLLEAYQTKRRADAGLTIATTHGLNQIFTSRHTGLAGLASLGLGLGQRILGRSPSLQAEVAAQSNHGTGKPARLMRGEPFAETFSD